MNEQKPAPLIYQAMAKIMDEIGVVKKTGYNEDQNYSFRSIDALYNAIQPVLKANKVFFTPVVLKSSHASVTSSNGKSKFRALVQVEYKFHATDGSSVVTTVDGEGIDSQDKATKKAMSAALKTMLEQVFCLAVNEPGENPEPKRPAARPQQKPANKSANKPETKPAQKPQLKKSIAGLIKAFGALNITEPQLCAYLGISEASKMSEADEKNLTVIGKELKAGTAKVTDYFKTEGKNNEEKI